MADLLLRDCDRAELVAEITAAVADALRPLLAEASAPLLVDGSRMAELASVSRPTIDRLVRENAIPSVKVGARRLYNPERVIEALEIQEGSGHDA